MPRHVHEHPDGERVQVDDLELQGWLTTASCTRCRGTVVYHVVYDALFCPGCNEWTAIMCSDPACMYCRVRPERPLAA